MLTFTTIQIQVPDAPTLMPVLGRYETNGRPAVLLYELEPALPGDDWAFVPCDNLKYLRAVERQGLAEVGTAVRYGNFGQLAVMAHLSPALIAKEG